MDRAYGHKERRKSPRFDMDWPLEYRVMDAPDAYGGIVVEGSEIGFRIHSVRSMSVGTRLNIMVLFQKQFQLTYIEVVARIVWKTACLKEDWSGYQYGIEFIELKKEDLRKLQELFSSPAHHRAES